MHTHTCTHTYVYVDMYMHKCICVCVCVCNTLTHTNMHTNAYTKLSHLQKIRINREEMLLNTGEQTPYTEIQEIMHAKEPYEKLWRAAVKFHAYHDKWMNGPLLEVDAEEVEEEVGIGANLERKQKRGALTGARKASM